VGVSLGEEASNLGIQWDAENRLIRVLQAATELASFTYDGRGRRAQKVAGGVTRTYVYDGDEILEERTSAADPATLGIECGIAVAWGAILLLVPRAREDVDPWGAQ